MDDFHRKGSAEMLLIYNNKEIQLKGNFMFCVGIVWAKTLIEVITNWEPEAMMNFY